MPRPTLSPGHRVGTLGQGGLVNFEVLQLVAGAPPKAKPVKASEAAPPPAAKSSDGGGNIGLYFGIGLALYVFYKGVNWSQGRSRKAAYDSALAALSSSPGDQSRRIAALEAGRKYYGGLRKGGAPTIYDEQAINNDLMARG